MWCLLQEFLVFAHVRHIRQNFGRRMWPRKLIFMVIVEPCEGETVHYFLTPSPEWYFVQTSKLLLGVINLVRIQNFQKTHISDTSFVISDLRIPIWGVRNISFSENLAHALDNDPLWVLKKLWLNALTFLTQLQVLL